MSLDRPGSRETPPARGPGAADLRPLVRAIVARTLREPPTHPDVEDATQEAVKRLLEAVAPTRALAVTVARNVAVDVLRARIRQRARTEGSAEEVEIADPAPLADQHVVTRERVRATEAAVSGLPPEQREALLLLVTEDLSYEDIGRRMDAPIGTVATWILRARRSIARALAGKEHDA